MRKTAFIYLIISFALMGTGAVAVWTGHPDGNWLIAPGLLILMILGLVGGLNVERE